MSRKSVFAIVSLIVFLACLILFAPGCRKTAEPNLPKETAQKKITIGVCMSTFTSPYASATVRELKRYTQEKGYGVIILDSQLDIQREAYNIENLMSRKVDIIIVNVVDSEGSRAALKKAAGTGFAVISSGSTVNRPEVIGIRAYTGSNYYDEAVVAAREAIKRKPDGKVVMITGTPGYSAVIEREKGFTDTISKEAPGMKILDIQSGNWMREEAQTVMSGFITKYGNKIDIVYAHDDNMAAGAVAALKAAGYVLENKPIVLSIGAMADGLPLVKEGWIDSTCLQSPKEEGRLAVDTGINIINGRQKESYKNYFLNTPPVDKSNVQEVIEMHIWD